MPDVTFKYGSDQVRFSMPESAVRLSHREPQKTVDPEKFIEELRSRLDGRGRTFRNAGIIVSDKTRLCQYPEYLPLLTRVLMESGLKNDDITFYIAYGTHPVQTDQESLDSYGPTFREFRFVHHDSRDPGRLAHLERTAMGTELKIMGEVLNHDLLITFGSISHHYFAGFGGGRKLLFPGLGGYEAILHNHSIYLDFENHQIRNGCQSGSLEENPLARDLEEISGLLPDRIEIHGILNSLKEVCEIHMGSSYAEFKSVCSRYDTFFRSREDTRYDMIVASSGGYPKDINFIQSHKSIHNAASFIRDGGTLVILAECRDGIGNKAFIDIFELGGWDPIFREMKKQYRNNAGTALAMLEKSRRISIRFVTSLDETACRMMGAVKTNVEEASQIIGKEKGHIAWIENASLLYK
jgi:lactate racemase